MKGFALLAGKNAEELWPALNVIMLTWALLALAPRYKHTPTLTLVAPVVVATLYTLIVLSLLVAPDEPGSPPDFFSLQGVVTMFQDPNAVFGGWVHYCCYDALVGRWILMDSVKRGASTVVHVLVIIPTLFLSMMFGPAGWLLYLSVVRTVILPDANGGVNAAIRDGGVEAKKL